MKKINNIFNTANKSLFAIGDTSRRSTPDSSGQRRILLSSCRGPISPLARGVPARAGCRKFGVWFAALVALFIATPSFAEPTELDKKTVASKAYVDTKQDKITTGLVEFDDLGVTATVPALVVTNSNGTTLNGNTIGFLDWDTYGNLNSNLDELPDTLVPSIGLLWSELQTIWGAMPSQWIALSWGVNNDNGANRTNAINAYNTTFGTGTNNWAGNGNHLINGQFLANSLALKQNKLPAKYTSTASVTQMGAKGGQTIELNTAGNVKRRYITAGGNEALTLKSGADNVILYINGTKTLEEFQISNFLNATGTQITENQNYIKGALVSLELLKDVYSELNSKITNNALPTGTTGTVVTYNGTNATTGVQEFGERAVYDPANTYNASTDATKLATMASVKYECAGYEAGHENDPDYCWLWALPN